MLTAKIYLHARRRRMQVVSEIKNLGKKAGDQYIFNALFIQNSSKQLLSFCQQRSRGFQTQFLQVTLKLVSWRQETVPQVTC